MLCNSNRSDKIVKFLKAYIISHGVPRQIRVDQGTNFMSKEVRSFCHKKGNEMLISPVNDHRATGCVERTIGSIKNSVLTYAREDKPEPLDRMVERALGALRFTKNATLNITPFEAHHGREANAVLRNLTKKPSLWNLNWGNVTRSKSACLDEQDPNAQAMPEPMDTNWGVRSDTDYDRKNRRHPMKLAEDQAANQDDEPGIVRAQNEPAEVPPAIVMQKTGERNMTRYKPLKSSIVNQSDHTIKMSNGDVLRKSGVALKKATIPKKRAPGQIAAPPTPWDLKRKLLARYSKQGSSKSTMGTSHRTMGNRSRFQILETAEDSESDEEDYLPLITTKPAVEPTTKGADTERERQGTSSGGQDQVQSKTITIRLAIMKRQQNIRWHAKKKSKLTEVRKTPKEIYHGRWSARQNKFQQPGGKSVFGNNDLFPIQVKIRRVPWTKQVQDDWAENEQQLRRWGRL